MTSKIIAQGAEAKIILTTPQRGGGRGALSSQKKITKDRISKSYRLKILDDKIRKQRTKSEKKLLEKACKIIDAPNPFPLKEFNKIEMPFIEGKKLSEHLDSFPLAKQKQICKIIGESIAKLHDANIIHGDLTTSNIILVERLPDNKQTPAPTIYFIDFGLGYTSTKAEDKAVDLHLLKQALEAKHFKHWEDLFKEILKGYKKFKDSERVLERLKAVEKRGRYRH